MKFIADLHLHSHYSRATSPGMNVRTLDVWGKKKGINLLATGDFTHPAYLKELKEALVEDGSGLLHLKEDPQGTKFIINGEIACIYKHNDKTRRLHVLVFVPSFEFADKVIAALEKCGCNLKSDGRPIIGLSGKRLLELLLSVDERCMLIPAHAWTPWFAVFGSKSGYDSLQECFEELTPHIFAIETGLSSDPAMNWRLSQLDTIAFISNSDAHSPLMVGREANVFDLPEPTYDALRTALQTRNPQQFLHTIEFYPQEGKYHYDGHAACNVVMSPEESTRVKNMCPVCKKELVLGVDHRVQAIADRAIGDASGKVPFKSIIPLYEIISECMQVGRSSKKVMALYESMIAHGGSEFAVLLDMSHDEIEKISNHMIAEAVMRMRAGKVQAVPGYDGIFGKITVFSAEELQRQQPSQKTLL